MVRATSSAIRAKQKPHVRNWRSAADQHRAHTSSLANGRYPARGMRRAAIIQKSRCVPWLTDTDAIDQIPRRACFLGEHSGQSAQHEQRYSRHSRRLGNRHARVQPIVAHDRESRLANGLRTVSVMPRDNKSRCVPLSTDTNAVEQIPRRACLLGEQDGQQTLGAARTTILTAFGAPGRSTCEVSASEWDRCSAGSGDLFPCRPKKRKDSALR